MICTVCIVLFIAWTLFVFYFMGKLLKSISYTETLDPNIKETHKPFERRDRKNWNIKEFYLVAIFMLPFRLIIFAGIMTIHLLVVTAIGCNNIKLFNIELPTWKRLIVRW